MLANFSPSSHPHFLFRIYYTAWHQQQQQQGQAASGKGQGQGQGQQQPPQHYYPYWPGYQHPHAAAYQQHHTQQQQQQLAAARGGQQQGNATTILPVAHQGKGQGNINCAQAVIERKKVKGTKKEFAPPKNIQSNKSQQHRRMDSKSSKSLSVSSSVGTTASLSKKRSREESFDEVVMEGRDDLNTKSLSLSDDQDDDNVSTSGLSLGGFSLGSLGE